MTTRRAAQQATGRTEAALTVGEVRITHPSKVLWPDEGITKFDLVRYYEAVAPVLLPYVKDCPLTLRPFPQGIGRAGFYRKDVPRGAPKWVPTYREVAESTGEPVDFVVASDERVLLWVAQMNSVEIHAWLSPVTHPDYPDWAVVDLDPPEGLPEAERAYRLRAAAQAARAVLEQRGLKSYPKRSGQSGLHVLVPLEPVHPYDAVRAVFEEIAQEACRAHPDLLTTEYEVAARGGRILFDYAQNAHGKTTVAPYSVRPRPGAPVAIPLTWEELDDPAGLTQPWTIRDVPDRLAQQGDVLATALTVKQRLP